MPKQLQNLPSCLRLNQTPNYLLHPSWRIYSFLYHPDNERNEPPSTQPEETMASFLPNDESLKEMPPFRKGPKGCDCEHEEKVSPTADFWSKSMEVWTSTQENFLTFVDIADVCISRGIGGQTECFERLPISCIEGRVKWVRCSKYLLVDVIVQVFTCRRGMDQMVFICLCVGVFSREFRSLVRLIGCT